MAGETRVLIVLFIVFTASLAVVTANPYYYAQLKELGKPCSSKWDCLHTGRCVSARCCSPHGYACKRDEDCCEATMTCRGRYSLACRN